MIKYCPDCKMSIGGFRADNARFCDRDGSLLKEWPKCQSCGAYCAPDAKFCEACGVSRELSPQQIQQEAN